jgi:hypothetical protein
MVDRADCERIADDPQRPGLTRHMAREALDALARVDTRLDLDAQAPTAFYERAPGEWTLRPDVRPAP